MYLVKKRSKGLMKKEGLGFGCTLTIIKYCQLNRTITASSRKRFVSVPGGFFFLELSSCVAYHVPLCVSCRASSALPHSPYTLPAWRCRALTVTLRPRELLWTLTEKRLRKYYTSAILIIGFYKQIDRWKKALVKNIGASWLGTEIYNKPTIRYRIEGVSW